MALYYSKTLSHALLYRLYAFPSGTAQPWSFTLYPGTQPSADNLSANWVSQSYYNTFLIHWQGSVSPWLHQNAATYSQGNFIEMSAFPPATTSYTSTTQVATWAVMWPSSISQATILAATGAVPSTNYIVCPVTNLGGSGVIRLVDNTILPSTVYSINDASISADNSSAVYF